MNRAYKNSERTLKSHIPWYCACSSFRLSRDDYPTGINLIDKISITSSYHREPHLIIFVYIKKEKNFYAGKYDK